MEEINLKALAEGNNPSQSLNELIDRIEADAVELRKFTITDTDNMVLLGKINEVVAYLKALMPQLDNITDESKTALEKAQQALDELVQVSATATNALDQANSAHNTAGNALEEADDAMQRLDAVEKNLGTKIIDTHGNTLTTAKFMGQNGINIDNAEDDPNTLDIRLDNTITQAIEDTHLQTETNKADIQSLNEKVVELTGDDTTLAERVTACENVNTQQTSDIASLNSRLSSTQSQIGEIIDVDNFQDKEIAQNKADIQSIVNTGLDESTLNIIKQAYYMQTFAKDNYLLINADSGFQETATPNQANFGIDGKNIVTGGYRSNAIQFSIRGDDGNTINVIPSGSTLFLQANLSNIMSGIAEKGSNYVKFINGLIIQWGNITPVHAGTTVTLPKPFSSSNYFVAGCATQINYKQIRAFAVTPRNTTNFKCYGQYSHSQSNAGITGGDVPFCWLAVGF